MSTREHRRSLVTDDRGAVMVMGIFMCSCLVGALWYLAGIGDAILYRERMQEAADAVAFSDAALHARGMNLIVLINLIMAVILSFRVVMRTGKLVLAVAASVFAGLGLIPGNQAFLTAAPPTALAATTLDNFDKATKPAIDGALNALVTVQEAIATTTPKLARLSATVSVGDKYKPVISTVAIKQPDDERLPVAKGKAAKLCAQASDVIPEIHDQLLTKVGAGFVADSVGFFLRPLIEAAAGGSPDYFCDLEAGASEPNTEDNVAVKAEVDKGIEARCDDPGQLLSETRKQFEAAENAWEEKCRKFGVTCEGRDANGEPLQTATQFGRPIEPNGKRTRQDELDNFKLERDATARSLVEILRQPDVLTFKHKCMAFARAEMKDRQANQLALKKTQQQNDPNNNSQNKDGSKSQGASGIAPMAVKGFENGGAAGQIIAAARGNESRLQPSAKLVRIGTLNAKETPQLVTPESAKMPAWAQAEMFYNCADTWLAASCNDDDEAMWHFRWRARLRRFNQPTDSTLQSLSFPAPRRRPEAFADKLAQDALAPGAVGFKSNAALRRDLSTLIQEHATSTQGVH